MPGTLIAASRLISRLLLRLGLFLLDEQLSIVVRKLLEGDKEVSKGEFEFVGVGRVVKHEVDELLHVGRFGRGERLLRGYRKCAL